MKLFPISSRTAHPDLDQLNAWLFRGLLFGILFFAIASRRPDILTNAQPWAEDGAVWMMEIHNNGFWRSIFLPQNGYYQTISKLTYGFALMFGVAKAALVANMVAIALRALLVLFLLSERMRFVQLPYRLAVAAYLLLMPNLGEGYVNITNAHWYTAIYMMMVLIAEPPRSRGGVAHDILILVISALSGPFVVFYAPCLAIKRWHEHGGLLKAIRRVNGFDMVMVACLTLQMMAILASSTSDRSTAPLGATLPILAQIIQQRVVLGTFFQGIPFPLPNSSWPALALLIVLAASIAMAAFRYGWRYQILALFPILMISFALAKPMISLTEPQWPVLLNAGAGERYFFVTNFFMFCHVTFLVSRLDRYAHTALLLFSMVMLFLYVAYFKISPLAEVGYKEQIRHFQQLPKGETMTIDINPPGWKMQLVR
jgi:hypothetical protein